LLFLIALLLQYILPQLPLIFDPKPPQIIVTPPASCPPPIVKNPFLEDLICHQSSSSDQSGTLYNTAPRNMGLAAEAQRIAAEFEYSSQDVNNGVKEFIKEMRE